jgi:hypothetical protein
MVMLDSQTGVNPLLDPGHLSAGTVIIHPHRTLPGGHRRIESLMTGT